MQQDNRKSLHLCLALFFICSIVCRTATLAQQHSTGLIAEGTIWQTRYYVTESNEPGPVVMIVGGIHGNEPAGSRAAEQIRHWKITKGKLIVLPAVNGPALKKESRLTPDVSKGLGNLNRNFPEAVADAPKCALSKGIWSVVCAERPDWLLDLHEGYDFTQINSKSVGSSVIAGKSLVVTEQARRMLDVLNETIEDPNKKFVLKSPPVKGSLARAADEVFGIKSMILETTFKRQPISLRTRQHKIMAHRFLTDLSMVSGRPDVLVSRTKPSGAICAALYDAGGAGSKGPGALEKDLGQMDNVVVRRIGVPEITAGALDQFDVIIMPGGSASKQAKALGTDGCRAIVNFVKDGGGYAGFCAGAYLASNNYDWSLKIIDARVIDRKHWKRGTGEVKIELTTEGRRLLSDEQGLIDIRYANGPLLAPDEDPNIPDFRVLAHFRTEINKNDAPEGVMKDTSAIIVSQFGKGRVFCSSPHPEYTDGLEPLIHKAIRWAAGR